jgi:hypothetical protein
MTESRYQAMLEHQCAMNKVTRERLQAHGVTNDSELRLDFFYVAPNDTAAKSLKALLEDQTDYDVVAKSSDDSWSVTGRTQPTTISPEILDQWVDWMITAGLEHQCEFDGWGTEV